MKRVIAFTNRNYIPFACVGTAMALVTCAGGPALFLFPSGLLLFWVVWCHGR